MKKVDLDCDTEVKSIYENPQYDIHCIGVDNKIHMCKPWINTTICNIKVKTKIVTDKDFSTKYVCGECSE